MDSAGFDTAVYDDMSANLLAQQPLGNPKSKKEEDSEWSIIYAHVEARLQSMRTWRWMKWTYFQVLAKFFLPFRYVWLVTANRTARGHPVNDAIVDSTGLLAVRTCAAGMWTGLTSPSRPWMKLANALPWVKLDVDGLQWLEDTLSRIYTVLQQSNFYSQMAQAFRDLVVFGTAVVIIYEDDEDVIRLYVPCAGEYFIDVGPRLDVDTIYREFAFNVLQIVGMFKVENCPPEVIAAWNTGGASLQMEFVVAHAIEPNFAVANRGKSADSRVFIVPEVFPYREIYWIRGAKGPDPLSRRGFRGKPFMVFRWSTKSNDPYGNGPCEDTLGDNKQLQLEALRQAEFIEKGVRPPMGANPELKNEPASIIPASVTYMNTDNGKKGFWALFEVHPQWVDVLTQNMKIVGERIERGLYVTLFMAISQMEGVQPRNQLELSKRDLERLQELGPVIELAEKELDVGIMRILNILSRRRMLTSIPASLHGVPLKVSYTSIMRLAQRSAESVAVKDVFQVAGALSSAAKAAGVPDPIRIINLDKALRHYGDLNEFPPSLFFTDGEVAQHDQIRTEEQQKAQIPGQAMAGVQAAKTLSETSLGGGSALSALTGVPQ